MNFSKPVFFAILSVISPLSYSNSLYHDFRGIIEGKKGNYDAPQNHFKKRPYNASYHFHLADLILKANRVEAVREYRLAFELDPFHIGAKKALGLP